RRPPPPARASRLRGPPRRRRGAARQRLGLGPAHGRVERRARDRPLPLAPLRLPQLTRPAEGRHPPARAPTPDRAFLQHAAQLPEAGLGGRTPQPEILRRYAVAPVRWVTESDDFAPLHVGHSHHIVDRTNTIVWRGDVEDKVPVVKLRIERFFGPQH